VITIDDRGLQVLACARDATMGAPVAESSPGDELVPLHAVQRLLAGESPVRIWRLHRGLTQTQLARAAKLTQSMVAKLEAGEKTPSLPSLKALAAALGVDLDDIA
jgi:DNA-binding XRE family transcriptional regulator